MRKALFGFFITIYASFAEAPDPGLLDSVLQKYVRDDGRVNYAGMRADSQALDRFVAQIANVSPDTAPELFPTPRHKLAYWLNCYNALVLKAFSSEYPAKRLRLKTPEGNTRFFYEMKHRVGGKLRSLGEIEDDSIRAFKDPRIHFAIVCASVGCPWLSRTAYRADNLDAQLENETARYLSQERSFRIKEERKEVWVGEIFKWYDVDFGGSRSAVLRFVAKYRTAEAKKLTSGTYRLRYIPYDWSPNDLR